MPSEEISKLRELTSELPIFPETTASNTGFKRHRMSCGNSMSWNLDPHSKHKAGVAKWFNSYMTEFPEHSHNGREWLIIKEGSLCLTIEDGEEQRLLPGQWAVIEPGVKHSARFLEDCWYYAITIPRDANWPD